MWLDMHTHTHTHTHTHKQWAQAQHGTQDLANKYILVVDQSH